MGGERVWRCAVGRQAVDGWSRVRRWRIQGARNVESDEAAVNGFYRLIEHPADVTVENILAPRAHGHARTVDGARDGTDLNFTRRPYTDGLQIIGKNQTGALGLHLTLAVNGLPRAAPRSPHVQDPALEDTLRATRALTRVIAVCEADCLFDAQRRGSNCWCGRPLPGRRTEAVRDRQPRREPGRAPRRAQEVEQGQAARAKRVALLQGHPAGHCQEAGLGRPPHRAQPARQRGPDPVVPAHHRRPRRNRRRDDRILPPKASRTSSESSSPAAEPSSSCSAPPATRRRHRASWS